MTDDTRKPDPDRIRVRLPGEDLGALYRAVDATMSHLDEAREDEERVPFAARLVRVREQGQDGEFIVMRGDLHVLHRALHVAAGHVDDDLIRLCTEMRSRTLPCTKIATVCTIISR